MQRESKICFSSKNKPLQEFDSETAALESARYVATRYGNNLSPYKCIKCNKWHLRPTGNYGSHQCSCCDRNGRSKTLYSSEKAAYQASKQNKKSLAAYPCPERKGWHLTSRM